MQTKIHADLAGLPEVIEANSILRSCVHCGFCTATCPTYLLKGDELDGPRGRIWLIKNLLEENAIEQKAVLHLDRCLGCRACESTCPSGVNYSRLLDIGRSLITTRRPLRERTIAWLLSRIVPRRHLFRGLLKLGRILRPVLPERIAGIVPPTQPALPSSLPACSGRGRVLLLEGCVQESATPNVNQAVRQLLAMQGIECRSVTGCCGALEYHSSTRKRGLRRMRGLVDSLDECLDEVDAIVSTASGCGITVREYPVYLANDEAYAEKAQRVASKVVDVAELLEGFEFRCRPVRVAVHTPCTLQHGPGLAGLVERILDRAGLSVLPVREEQLCCGSAGSYSFMQPAISSALRDRKLVALGYGSPEVIVTANVGCQLHLQSTSGVPVMHWVELLLRSLVTDPRDQENDTRAQG